MPQIVINIAPDGQTSVDAQGYSGASCKDATRAIEQALGVTTNDNQKPEYRQSSTAAAKRAEQR